MNFAVKFFVMTVVLCSVGPVFAKPVIQYAGVNLPSIQFNNLPGALKFSLIVTDDSPTEKITGAVLIDPIKNWPYGTFQSSAGSNGFHYVASMSEIFEVRAWDPFGDRARPFRVIVYNSNGETTTVDIFVTISGYDEILASQALQFSNFRGFQVVGNYDSMLVERVMNGVTVPGYFWMHNSRGTVARVTLIRRSGYPILEGPLIELCQANDYIDALMFAASVPEISSCEVLIERTADFCAAAGRNVEVEYDSPRQTARLYCDGPEFRIVNFQSIDGTIMESRVIP